MKTICIYHSRDLDGFTSGAIVKHKFPNAQLIGYDYGEPFPELDLEPDGSTEVIMVDVSIPPLPMVELAKKCKLTFIDHHVSAIKDLNDFAFNNANVMTGPLSRDPWGISGSTTMIAFFTVGLAACELTWMYYYAGYAMPKAVELLGKYDTWRNQDIEEWNNKILPFQYGMRMVCSSPETMPKNLLANQDAATSRQIADVIKDGKLILDYQRTQNAILCKRAFEIRIGEFIGIALNAGGVNSITFESVWNPEKHDLMVPFFFNGKFWVVSLYTTKDLNCSLIAKSFGGGGHARAAGFELKDIIPLLNGEL